MSYLPAIFSQKVFFTYETGGTQQCGLVSNNFQFCATLCFTKSKKKFFSIFFFCLSVKCHLRQNETRLQFFRPQKLSSHLRTLECPPYSIFGCLTFWRCYFPTMFDLWPAFFFLFSSFSGYSWFYRISKNFTEMDHESSTSCTRICGESNHLDTLT